MNMPPRQNPFSLYDFLGYFVPGASLLYALLFLFSPATDMASFAQQLSSSVSFDHAEVYVPFVLGSYIAGHLLSFASSVTVERYSLWQLGYPSKYLTGHTPPPYISWAKQSLAQILGRLVVPLLLTPISILDFVIGKWLRLREVYADSLDPLLTGVIRRKVLVLLESKLEAGPTTEIAARDQDYFRLAYHYTLEHAPAHAPKMQNYVALYGFTRTMALLFVIAWWADLTHAITHCQPLPRTVAELSALAALGYLMYMNFNKFYRRFSLEVLMALTVVTSKSPEATLR